jgi:hypothetical protein
MDPALRLRAETHSRKDGGKASRPIPSAALAFGTTEPIRSPDEGATVATTQRGDLPGRHERLWSIAGRWATDGYVIADPPVPVTGFDTYEVLAGGYFLVHHVDVTVGEQPVRAIEIIGEPEPSGDGFLARSFDDRGSWEVMRVTVDDEGVFHFAGGPDVAPAARPADGETASVRSTLTLAADGGSMTALWERSPDGRTWEPWMRISFRKLG